jgi:dTDP-4-amino-4,6-dideoxygalactose transaminase
VKTTYNPWPLGKLPEQLRRPEPEYIKELGYKWQDAREINLLFEQELAGFAGSKYAVLTDSCTHGIYLSLQYKKQVRQLNAISIPRHTYASLPMLIHQSGFKVSFREENWTGIYELGNAEIFDSAVRFTEGMYVGENFLQVLSFQIKKRLPIGRGGAILTNDYAAYKWLKLAVYDGRDLEIPYESPNHLKIFGWHFYMTPEDAARGLILMKQIPKQNPDSGSWQNYPDLLNYNFIKDNFNA